MRLTLFFLAALAWGQETVAPKPEPTIEELKQDISKLEKSLSATTKLLAFYKNSLFACTEREIDFKVLSQPNANPTGHTEQHPTVPK
jgi:hypothetical protein